MAGCDKPEEKAFTSVFHSNVESTPAPALVAAAWRTLSVIVIMIEMCGLIGFRTVCSEAGALSSWVFDIQRFRFIRELIKASVVQIEK